MKSKKTNFCVLSFLLLLTLSASGKSSIPYKVDTWNIKPKTAIDIFMPGGTQKEIDFSKDNYNNRIFNYITNINKNLLKKIKIINVKTNYHRDFMFINDRLVCIMEEQSNMPSSTFKNLFLDIKKNYGSPEISKDEDFTTYSFKNNLTNVILNVKTSNNLFNIRLYFYSKRLFNIIMLED